MIRVLFLFALFPFASIASTTQELKPWTPEEALTNTAALERNQVIRANFIQEKSVPVLSKPLVSNGEFVFSKKTGLLLNTKQPFAITLAISPSGIIQWNQGIARKQDDSLSQYLGNWLAKLLNGDVKALSFDFDILGKKQGEAWMLSLLPKNNDFKKFLRKIECEGSRNISKLKIEEVSGVNTKIQFSNVRTEGADLSTEDLKYFDIPKKP